MPAWWRGKSKSTSNSSNFSRRKEEAKEEKDSGSANSISNNKPGKKEKAKSFDEAISKKNRGNSPRCVSPFAFDSDAERREDHPLPRPSMISSASSLPHEHGMVSDYVSSVSSSGSSDETPDLAFYRCSEPVNFSRGRSILPELHEQQPLAEDRNLFSCGPVLENDRLSNVSISPRKEFQLYSFDASPNGNAYSHRRLSVGTPRSRSPVPGSRGYTLSTSPVHLRGFNLYTESPNRKQDDLKSPPHPLPLPPCSPTSPTTRPLRSQWKKGKLIGRGTFGHVYVGFNSGSGNMCAIKEVSRISGDSNSKECLKQLGQEITLLSQLSHPNIVQYYGSELGEDTLSVYLEYVSGGSIHKLLQEYGSFREPVIRSYTGQILSGLAYLHGRNTVHRDIKGANILVDPNGEIKLADFGMAKHISAYTSIRSFKGSPYWMAPEVIMNSNGYNLSVDIWSLGCTILEMATSKPPWSQYEGVAAIFKIGNSKDIPDIPDHISNDGKSFLKLCLQRDPSSRPTAAQLMEHPFVRDQPTIKLAKAIVTRDTFLSSSSDGTHTPTARESPHHRSSSLHDRDYVMRNTIGYSPALKIPSDMVSIRTNLSLPVSPCSSPLRQMRLPDRSCFPSPPHSAFTVGTSNYAGVSNYMLHPMKPNKTYQDPWPDIPQIKARTPSGSPRR